MNSVNRRDFLKSSIGIAATVAVLPQRSAFSANDKVIVGVMGLGGRGRFLAESFARSASVAFTSTD